MSQPTLVSIANAMLADKNHVSLVFPGVKATTIMRDVGSADVLFHLEILNHNDTQGEYIVEEYLVMARTGFVDVTESGLDITVLPMHHATKNTYDVDKEMENNYLSLVHQ